MSARSAGRAFSPLDEQLVLRDLHWSEGVVRQVVRLSGRVPYEEVVETLQEVGQIGISKTSAWRLSQRWGEQLKTQVAATGGADWASEEPADRMSASLDGAMVYVLEEGWKELKVGTISEVVSEPVLDPTTLEEEPLARARNTSYVAQLGGPEEIGKTVWQEALRRGWLKVPETEVVADGAGWIWNLAGDYFYDSTQVVDWYHATQHLANAAQQRYPQDEGVRKRWLHEYKTILFQGHADRVVQHLQKKAETALPVAADALRQEAGYFETHKHRMFFLDFRNDGWLIGSGTVESAAKQYKHRFTGPGMRWSRSGLANLIPVRSLVLSHAFTRAWQSLYFLPTF
jgi:hypothetical protein